MALEVDDSGQPQQSLIFTDGMTELTGNTPKLGANRHSKVDHVIANRVIGIEVYCGPNKSLQRFHGNLTTVEKIRCNLLQFLYLPTKNIIVNCLYICIE